MNEFLSNTIAIILLGIFLLSLLLYVIFYNDKPKELIEVLSKESIDELCKCNSEINKLIFQIQIKDLKERIKELESIIDTSKQPIPDYKNISEEISTNDDELGNHKIIGLNTILYQPFEKILILKFEDGKSLMNFYNEIR